MNTRLTLAILTGTIILQSCSESKGETGYEKTYLVSAEAKSKMSAAELKQSYGMATAYISNGFTAYRITYNTTNTDGNKIVASGALFVPDIKTPLPLLNYNHGTYFPSQEHNAPSYIGSGEEVSLGKLFSAAGFLVVMPDYIGYGSTKKQDHPYGAYNVIASSVIDMLKAVKEFCLNNKIGLSGKNYFSGWSEGAAVTLATVKALEEDHKGEFTPTSTVLNAGPYYTSAFAEHVLESKQPLRHMSSYAWILQTYNRIYKINKPANYYFTESAASDLVKNPEARINKDPQQLFTSSFRENFKAGKEIALQKAMQENDLWNWKPASKIVFCHGDRDEYVPLFNSEKAFNAMKAKGADVKLQVFKGATHSSGVYGYLQQVFLNFI